MHSGSGAARAARTVALALAFAMAGCGHWPWHHSPPPAPAPVHELDVTTAEGAAANFPQYWQRNTLLVDLSTARGEGAIVIKPPAGSSWPVRVAFRVTPGAMSVLDVRAAERVVLPITSAGTTPVDLELPPGTYTPQSAQMSVAWRSAATQ